MLIQDTLTGQLREVPDPALGAAPLSDYGAGQPQMVYDGLGNPLGLWAALAAKALPLAARILPKVSRFIPRVRRFLPQVGRLMQPRAAAMPLPQPATVPQAAALPDIPPDAAEPEPQIGETVYDGLGNPVGYMPSFRFRPPGIRFRPPSLPAQTPGVRFRPPGVSSTAPRVGMLAPHLHSGLAQLRARYLPALRQMRQLLQQAQSQGQPPDPALLERYRRLLSHYRSRLQRLREYGGRPGWVGPAMPYTGLGPTHPCMQYATWPGSAGLVQATPAAAVWRGRRRSRRR